MHWKMVKDPEEAADSHSQSTGMASNSKEEAGLRALAQTRAYQRALVNLAIDGRIDKDKFVIHMQAAHAQFSVKERKLTEEKDQQAR